MAKRVQSGSFLENLSVPSEGSTIWFLDGQVNQVPAKAIVKSVEQTFYGSEYSLLLETLDGRNTKATTASAFDHKPKKVEIEDCYGIVKVWR